MSYLDRLGQPGPSNSLPCSLACRLPAILISYPDMPNRLLGIAPGSRTTGYAVLEQNQTSYRLIACNVIKAEKIESHSERLQLIFDEITAVIKKYAPHECAIETPDYGVDQIGRAHV